MGQSLPYHICREKLPGSQINLVSQVKGGFNLIKYPMGKTIQLKSQSNDASILFYVSILFFYQREKQREIKEKVIKDKSNSKLKSMPLNS